MPCALASRIDLKCTPRNHQKSSLHGQTQQPGCAHVGSISFATPALRVSVPPGAQAQMEQGQRQGVDVVHGAAQAWQEHGQALASPSCRLK